MAGLSEGSQQVLTLSSIVARFEKLVGDFSSVNGVLEARLARLSGFYLPQPDKAPTEALKGEPSFYIQLANLCRALELQVQKFEKMTHHVEQFTE